MKLLFVAEQFVPPVFSGSTLVYDLWLKTLAGTEGVELYGLFFEAEGAPTPQTHACLEERCRDYLILPGHSRSRTVKALRALGRLAAGTVFAPAVMEEMGRDEVQGRISTFLARNRPDVMVLSKLNTVHLVGLELLRDFTGPLILDMHDDFVAREETERRVLARLMDRHTELTGYGPYRMARIRQRLSRLSSQEARRQERQLLTLFDRILISSRGEFVEYAGDPTLTDRCVHLPWPLGTTGPARAARPDPAFHAGFIASDAPFNLEGLLYFTRWILPDLKARIPNFRMLVTGGVTVPFARLGPPPDGMVLERSVADVSAFYDRIGVAVVPLLSGTGVSLKTLEAVRFGRPVVATSAGARGLATETLPGLEVVDDPAVFAEKVAARWAGGVSVPIHQEGADHDATQAYGRRIRQICGDLLPEQARDGGARGGEVIPLRRQAGRGHG